MKPYILVLCSCFYSIGLFGQMATYDVRNDMNQTNQYLLSLKDFEEATSQTKVLKDTYDFYKKAQEALQKVNRAVNDFYAVENIIKSQVKAIKQYADYLSQARSFKYVSKERVTSFTTQLTELNNSIYQLVKQAELVLRDDYFKLSDADRLKILSDIDTKMSEKKTLMRVKYKKLKAEEDDNAIMKSFKK